MPPSVVVSQLLEDIALRMAAAHQMYQGTNRLERFNARLELTGLVGEHRRRQITRHGLRHTGIGIISGVHISINGSEKLLGMIGLNGRQRHHEMSVDESQ